MSEDKVEELDTAAASNPLLAYGELPRFDAIEASQIVPGLRSVLAEQMAALEAIEMAVLPSSGEVGYDDLVVPIAGIGDRLGFAWGIVQHLMGVQNSDALREAQDQVQPEVVAFALRMGQSRPIYDALCALREGPGFAELDPAQQRVLASLIRDARHGGVGLDGEARERFNAIAQEMADLATRFSNHVLDATVAYSLMLRVPAEVEGLPQSLLELAAQSAREAGEVDASADAGPWRITLEAPSLVPFLEHSPRRDLREALYRTYVARASSGDLDNRPLIETILALRSEQAELLGYGSYAELSLSTKMAPDIAAVENLLGRLREASFQPAREDLEALAAFARERGAPEAEDLRHWDIAFWAERLRERRYAYTEEALRPYFPFPKVLEGLFALSQRLFGIGIESADGEVPVWHPDVRFFRIRDEKGRPIAACFLDPYSRSGEKRGGAWMDECVGRASSRECDGWKDLHEGARLPVAYLVCNQMPPVDGKPSLMSFDEVKTLFHEFGHGLQHMLTRVEASLAAGIRNIEWDAVELPSQFMENWCYHRETLRGLSAHVDSGEALPDELFDKLEAARTYRSGTQMLRQLYFSFTDLALHHDYRGDDGRNAFDVQREVAAETTVLPPLPEDRSLCSFGHIFAGGYAAGYYSYKWSEVLSADAFAAFEEADLDNAVRQREVGRRFRDTVLAHGGGRPPMDVFRSFRGREPRPDALLRHAGLAES